MADNEEEAGRALREPALLASLPEPASGLGPPGDGQARRFPLADVIADLEAADEVALFEAPFGHLALCREAASWLRELSAKGSR